jgi:hypothetical protein
MAAPVVILLIAAMAAALLVFRKRDAGKDVTAEEFAADIEKFIDGSATAMDWDDFVTFPLRDAALEKERKRCLDVLLERPRPGCHDWCSDEGKSVLVSVRDRLTKNA